MFVKRKSLSENTGRGRDWEAPPTARIFSFQDPDCRLAGLSKVFSVAVADFAGGDGQIQDVSEAGLSRRAFARSESSPAAAGRYVPRHLSAVATATLPAEEEPLAAARGRTLPLLRRDGSGWTPAAGASYGPETRRAALTEHSPFAVDDDAEPAFAGDFQGTAVSLMVNEEKPVTLPAATGDVEIACPLTSGPICDEETRVLSGTPPRRSTEALAR